VKEAKDYVERHVAAHDPAYVNMGAAAAAAGGGGGKRGKGDITAHLDKCSADRANAIWLSIATFVVVHGLAFSIIDSFWFHGMILLLNAGMSQHMISSSTLKRRYLDMLFAKTKLDTLAFFAKYPNRKRTLSVDGVTNNNGDKFDNVVMTLGKWMAFVACIPFGTERDDAEHTEVCACRV
jgi:hypothetical protein